MYKPIKSEKRLPRLVRKYELDVTPAVMLLSTAPVSCDRFYIIDLDIAAIINPAHILHAIKLRQRRQSDRLGSWQVVVGA